MSGPTVARRARVHLRDGRELELDALYEDVVYIVRRDWAGAPPTRLPLSGGGSVTLVARDVLAVDELPPEAWPW